MGVTLSIITVCYNNLAELVDTCKSVESQSQLPFEHIIVNGSTDDEIKNWLLQETQPLYRLTINERDHGISDAFNKGINTATGEIVLMLNAGDLLSNPQVLETALLKFEQDHSLMWLHGMCKYQRAGIWVTLGKPYEVDKIYRGMRSICHQTMFVKRSLHQKHGLYDTSLKIGMDFDFLIRIRNEKFKFLPSVLAIFAPGGTSMQDFSKTIAENTFILKKYGLAGWKHKLWTYRLILLTYLLNSKIGKTLYKLKVNLKMANI